METTTSNDAGTLKKKRNRSHKKPKAKVAATEQHDLPTGNENEPPVPVSSEKQPAVAHTETQQQEAGETLARKPSRRRKRKPKSVSEDQHTTKDDRLESLAVEEKPVHPAPPKSVDCKAAATAPAQSVIEKKEIKPVAELHFNLSGIENISLEDIFPRSNAITFDAVPRSGRSKEALNTGEVAPPRVQRKQQRHTIDAAKEGLDHIECEALFPSDEAVGRANSNQLQSNNKDKLIAAVVPAAVEMSAQSGPVPKTDKSREEVLAEREAKKAAKLAAKGKGKSGKDGAAGQQQQQAPVGPAKKPQSQKAEPTVGGGPLAKSDTDASICEKLKDLHISDAGTAGPPATKVDEKPVATKPEQLTKAERKAQFEAQNPTLAGKQPGAGGDSTKPPKPTLSKAERRAIQEAQRAAKAEAQQVKAKGPVEPEAGKKAAPSSTTGTGAVKPVKKTVGGAVPGTHGAAPRKHIVNLFNHLHQPKFAAAEIINSPTLHPAVTKLGVQYAGGTVVGSKARCLALLRMLNQLIHDYETPPEKEFCRSFEETLNLAATHLQRCRPFSVSMTNALRHVKMNTRQLDAKLSDSEQKECLLEAIEAYIRDHMEKAEEAICISVQEKIYDGDVILTYGCSSLIKHILEEANRREKRFRVIIVNARPREEEHEMLEQLVRQGVHCVCVLINAVSYVMPEVTKVLLGAHALLANGSVMSRVGTAQIALVAKAYNVPVLVCCETHKFTERVQTDAFVYNELGNPCELVMAPKGGHRDLSEAKPMLAGWETISSLTILNLHYDVTPPELVTAVVTEVAILPCTSVPVILRIKPSDVAY
ncbi:translation initiation factor eIF-2B subunit delta [Anopheles aquasalis]|uniref:translation initiation factor eIF-2B subunit delta n=1 Tax=Anopheles aquasalis TaxID=42839 RepID=UPI00215AB217|nr:translation initiation factor eIF-2B subunit delta [Anopheles aquasalis]